MGHKSRLQIKTFDCGHKGFGKYCHLCLDLTLGRLAKTEDKKYTPENKIRDKVGI